MTSRTRYFVIGAGLILTVGLGTGLVAFYSGAMPHSTAPAGLDELSYVPADSTIVGYANVRDLMNSELRQKMRQVLPSGSERDQFLAETGIDIERDIDYVVAALHAGTPNSGGIVLVHTNANQVGIENFVTQHGGTVSDYHGKRMLLMPEGMHQVEGGQTPADANGHGGSVAFLEVSLMAVGDRVSVERAIDAKAGANVAANQEMMSFITDAQNQMQNAWVVGRFDGVSQTMNLPAPVSSQLSAVQWFSVAGHVNGGLTGRVRLDARDDAAAENLRDIVRGALALARLQMGHDSKMDNVINSLQMQGTGKTVELSFSVPSEVFDIINGAAGLANLGRGKDMKDPKDLPKGIEELKQLKEIKK